MRVLLPPSETKRKDGGNSFFAPEEIAFDHELSRARKNVREALETLSKDPEAATKALKLGAKSRDEIEYNLSLSKQHVLPAALRYTGVLYDALAYESLLFEDKAAAEWVRKNVYIQSALFGLIGAGDQIPAYRISADSRLQVENGAGGRSTLKKAWVDAHRELSFQSLDETALAPLIIDMRSKSYVDLAPIENFANPDNAFYLTVMTRAGDGQTRALNHFNKMAKGKLVNAMARTGLYAQNISDVLEWGRVHGFEFESSDRILTLITNIGVSN